MQKEFYDLLDIIKKTDDLDELKKQLQGVFLDEIGPPNYLTVAGQLASETNQVIDSDDDDDDSNEDNEQNTLLLQKIELLRRLGANSSQIAKGFAIAKNHHMVELYCNKYRANVTLVAAGYAIAGEHKLVRYLFKEHGARAEYIVEAYAFVNNNEALKQYDKESRFLFERLRGYALAGDNSKVLRWYNSGIYSVIPTDPQAMNLDRIASAFAIREDWGTTRLFISRLHDSDRIYEGLIINGDFKKAVSSGGYPGTLARYVKRHRNHPQQIKLFMTVVLDRYLKDRESIQDNNGNTKEFIHSRFFSRFQKSYQDKCEAVAQLKSALDGEQVDLSQHLSSLRNGDLGNKLRSIVSSGLFDSLVGKEVRTVSAFVDALQQKCNNDHLPTDPAGQRASLD